MGMGECLRHSFSCGTDVSYLEVDAYTDNLSQWNKSKRLGRPNERFSLLPAWHGWLPQHWAWEKGYMIVATK